jgi:hypothetical protein
MHLRSYTAQYESNDVWVNEATYRIILHACAPRLGFEPSMHLRITRSMLYKLSYKVRTDIYRKQDNGKLQREAKLHNTLLVLFPASLLAFFNMILALNKIWEFKIIVPLNQVDLLDHLVLSNHSISIINDKMR